jgi:hypothetical protein
VGDLTRLTVRVLPTDDSDAEELAELLVQLHDELRDLDLAPVSVLPEEAPDRAKGAGTLAGKLLIQFGTLDGLRAAISGIRSWVARTRRGVEITMDGDTLKLTSATAEQQEEIIEAWLAKHRPNA